MRSLLFLLAMLGFASVSPSPATVAAAQEQQCPECKAKLKPGAAFCPNCGKKVSEKECAECKSVLKPGAKFCVKCGKKVEESPAPETKPDEKKETPALTSKPAGPVGEDRSADRVKQKRDEELRKFGTSSDAVNRSIDRGAAYLAKRFVKGDLSIRDEYLAAYALIQTPEYHANGRLRGKIDEFLRGAEWQMTGVYCAGVRALALEATGNPELRALARECAQYLVESQGPRGTWTYLTEVPIDSTARAGEKESAITIVGGEPLDGEVRGEEVPRKGTAKNPSDGDNSTTQFAVLGLHAASKCGFRVPRDVWEKCLKEMEQRRDDDGGWPYDSGPKNQESYGSMTCAGICTIALCRYYLGEKDYLDSSELKSGFQWLARNFDVAKNPKKNEWELYYLYSVERVGVFCATDTIGEHRWYGMGARHLVDSQAADGSWKSPSENEERSTSFALLFLTRATSPVRSIKRGGSGALETHVLGDTMNIMFIVDASGSMREEMDGKEKFQIVKEVVASVVNRLPEGATCGLRVYGHRRTALDEDADLDSELLIPPGPINKAEFVAKVRALECKGKTPLTYSLLETIKDVERVGTDLDVVTLLLTDGGETTRGASPPEAAAKLAASRKGMKVHVVGFDINDDDWREQLEKTAAAGGGRYFPARKSKGLLSALSLATVGEAEYSVREQSGKELFKGKLGDRHELPEGKYVFSVALDGLEEKKAFWINTETTSHATVDLGKILKRK